MYEATIKCLKISAHFRTYSEAAKWVAAFSPPVPGWTIRWIAE